MAHRLLQNAVFDLYHSPHPRESAVERQLAAVVRKAINYFRHETITWSRFEEFREHMDTLDARTREQALNHVIDTASRFLNVGDSVLAFAWIYAAVYDGGKAVISRSMLRLSRFKAARRAADRTAKRQRDFEGTRAKIAQLWGPEVTDRLLLESGSAFRMTGIWSAAKQVPDFRNLIGPLNIARFARLAAGNPNDSQGGDHSYSPADFRKGVSIKNNLAATAHKLRRAEVWYRAADWIPDQWGGWVAPGVDVDLLGLNPVYSSQGELIMYQANGRARTSSASITRHENSIPAVSVEASKSDMTDHSASQTAFSIASSQKDSFDLFPHVDQSEGTRGTPHSRPSLCHGLRAITIPTSASTIPTPATSHKPSPQTPGEPVGAMDREAISQIFHQSANQHAIQGDIQSVVREVEAVQEVLPQTVQDVMCKTVQHTIQHHILSIVYDAVQRAAHFSQTVQDVVHGTVQCAVGDGVQSVIRDAFRDSMKETILPTIEKVVSGTVRDIVRNTISNTVHESVKSTLHESVQSTFQDSVQTTVRQSVRAELANYIITMEHERARLAEVERDQERKWEQERALDRELLQRQQHVITEIQADMSAGKHTLYMLLMQLNEQNARQREKEEREMDMQRGQQCAQKEREMAMEMQTERERAEVEMAIAVGMETEAQREQQRPETLDDERDDLLKVKLEPRVGFMS